MNLCQCSCCDYFTLSAEHDYEICPVCFWEDDSSGLEELDETSGANHGLTLRQGRANFLVVGACEPSMVKHVVSVEQRHQYLYKQRTIQ